MPAPLRKLIMCGCSVTMRVFAFGFFQVLIYDFDVHQ